MNRLMLPANAMSPPQPCTCTTPDSSSLETSTKRAGKEDVLDWLLMEDCWSGSEGYLSQACAVRFIDDPYSSLLVFQSSSSYITINGNEESCGSSFSDSGTSLMATHTLHSTTTTITTTTTPIQYHAFISNADYDDEEEEEEKVDPTFLGLQPGP